MLSVKETRGVIRVHSNLPNCWSSYDGYDFLLPFFCFLGLGPEGDLECRLTHHVGEVAHEAKEKGIE